MQRTSPESASSPSARRRMETGPPPPGFEPPTSRMAVALLALVGFFIALYLLFYAQGAFGTLLCGEGGCETVQSSEYAVFAGVPVPLIGVIGYALLLGTALAGLQPGPGRSRGLAIAIFLLASAAFAFSMYLTGIEAFVLNAWCRWCIASAVVATLIFVAALPEVRRVLRGD